MEEMLLHTDNTEAATAEIESVGGRVIIQMGNDLLVAKVPRDFIAKKRILHQLQHTSLHWHHQIH